MHIRSGIRNATSPCVEENHARWWWVGGGKAGGCGGAPGGGGDVGGGGGGDGSSYEEAPTATAETRWQKAHSAPGSATEHAGASSQGDIEGSRRGERARRAVSDGVGGALVGGVGGKPLRAAGGTEGQPAAAHAAHALLAPYCAAATVRAARNVLSAADPDPAVARAVPATPPNPADGAVCSQKAAVRTVPLLSATLTKRR